MNTNTTTMNNNTDELEGRGPDPLPTSTSRQVPGRLGTRARRFTVAVIAATSAIVGGAVGLLPASEASAQYILTPYFGLDSRVTCDPTRNTVHLVVEAGPQPAYRGMTVQYQTYVAIGNSASWSAWSGPVQLWNLGQPLKSVSVSAPDNVAVQAYVQLRYWTPNGWSTPQGTWATPYMISRYDFTTPYLAGACFT